MRGIRSLLILLGLSLGGAATACEQGQQPIFSCQATDAKVSMCQSALAMHLAVETQSQPRQLRVPLAELRWEMREDTGTRVHRFTFLDLPFAYELTIHDPTEDARGGQPAMRQAWVGVTLLHGGATEVGRYSCAGSVMFDAARIHGTPGPWLRDP